MTTITTSRVLVLVLAVLALAVTAPVVSAHGNDTTADPTPDAPVNGSAAEWADWMESHMTDHMGPGAVEWMESHMGLTVEGMAEDMANGDAPASHMSGGTNGQFQNGGVDGHC